MNIGTFFMGIIYMAIISVLVQPDSSVATAVKGFSDALVNMTSAAIRGELPK
jgi:hypothetical protein